MKYLIIGAGIAGTSAAETIRSIDIDGEITLITEERYPLYSRLTLASYVSGRVVKERMLLRTGEAMEGRRITFLTGMKAESIDIVEKIVSCTDEHGAIKILSYDKLLIATGGKPNKSDVKGSDGAGIFYMHSLDDGEAIHTYAKGKKKAVVAGGSLIGIDFITAFLNLGLEIDFLIRGKAFLHNILDIKASNLVHNLLESKGVHIYCEEEIQEFLLDEAKQIKGVMTNKGERAYDIAGLGLGIKRVGKFIADTQINCNKGILTDIYLESSVKDIYVAGDAAEYFNPLFNRYLLAGDWVSARGQGICAGKNMAGVETPHIEIPANTSNMFGTNVSIIGFIDNPDAEGVYTKEERSSYIKVFAVNGITTGCIAVGYPELAIKVRKDIANRESFEGY